MRIGVHVSIAGGIYESIIRASALGCDTMQIFSRNPRGWQSSTFNKRDAQEFRRRKAAEDICPVVVHIPYLINLGTPDDGLYQKSIRAYIEDVRRSDMLEAEYFVTHAGAHVGSGEKRGLARFTSALNEIIEKAKPRTTILLETTAGSGSNLGYSFGHLGNIIGGVRNKKKIGVCLDTAHLFASGYNIATKQGLEDTLKAFDRLIGLELIRVIHFNDSKAAFGSCVDRHEHIGDGQIGFDALARVINHPAFTDAAFIMETPKTDDNDDKRNLALARDMVNKKKKRAMRAQWRA